MINIFDFVFYSACRKTAAAEIQRVWRGHRVRRVLREQKYDLVLAWRWDGPSQQVQIHSTSFKHIII